jgi:hypothetical protein
VILCCSCIMRRAQFSLSNLPLVGWGLWRGQSCWN